MKVAALVVLGALVMFGIFFYTYYRNKTRMDELRQFCLAKGWQIQERDA